MRFTETSLAGAYLVDLERHEDDRGFFARAFCANEFREHGLNPAVAQINTSSNHRAGTLRGLHYQEPPALEAKFIRCVRGALYSVIIDMRPGSPSRLEWIGVELTAEGGGALYVPELFANSYVTLVDDTVALYQVSEFYTPGTERGLRFDDPALGIDWPIEPAHVSEKDRSWPLLKQP
jgi:dTDP-4-dehydrorhamnose 3,5-epimerase